MPHSWHDISFCQLQSYIVFGLLWQCDEEIHVARETLVHQPTERKVMHACTMFSVVSGSQTINIRRPIDRKAANHDIFATICAYTESKKHADTHPFGAGHHIVPFACRRTNIGLIIIIQMLEMEKFTINLFMFENMKIRKVSISSAKCVLEVFQFIWHLFYSCDVYDGLWIVVNNVCWGVVSYVGLWMTKQWTLNRER